MKFRFICQAYIFNRNFNGTQDEAIAEVVRLSNFHGVAFTVLGEGGARLGQTLVPEPSFIFVED